MKDIGISKNNQYFLMTFMVSSTYTPQPKKYI